MAGGYNIQSEVNRSQAIINKVYKDKRYPPDGSKFPNTKDGRLALQFARKEYARVKAEAKRKFKVYPSAYANAWLVRTYKKRGGTYA